MQSLSAWMGPAALLGARAAGSAGGSMSRGRAGVSSSMWLSITCSGRTLSSLSSAGQVVALRTPPLPLPAGAAEAARRMSASPAAQEASERAESKGASKPKWVESSKRDTLAEYGQFLEKAKRQKNEIELVGDPYKRLETAMARCGKGKVTCKVTEQRVDPEAEGRGEGEESRWVCELVACKRTFHGESGVSGDEAKKDAATKASTALRKEGLLHFLAFHIEKRKKKEWQGGGEKLAPPKKAIWKQLQQKRGRLRAIHEPREIPIPELAHGLEKILFHDNSRATSLNSNVKGLCLNQEYLSKIEQPQNINWLSIAPFTPSSRDENLHKIALRVKAKFKASTSSISGLFSHLYQVQSNFRPVDTSYLSGAFKNHPRNFSKTVAQKPAAVIIRPRDGIYGIDAEPEGDSNHQILIDLGKTLERMLTMPPDEFKELVVLPEGGECFEVPPHLLASTYNFSQFGEFCMRSQLDCVHGGDKIFDLKTRATHAIRNSFSREDPGVDPKDRYKRHVETYKIDKQRGQYNSFEREVYDMMRSAFLKYSVQLRIGRMHGAFVTYHNTAEIFGFQYIPLSTIDRLIFGNTHMALTHFDTAAKLISHILNTVIKSSGGGDGKPIRMSIAPFKESRMLIIESRPVLSEEVEMPEEGSKDDPKYSLTYGEPKSWYLWVRTKLNGEYTEEPWMFTEKDKFETEFCMIPTEDYQGQNFDISKFMTWPRD